MATYDPKQVLADYANGRITPEMAAGHSLQHINKLYELQATANAVGQAKIDALEKRIQTQQATIDRLTAFMEKTLTAQKARPSPSLSKPEKP
ncbi:MAG: hypothetical protein U0350_25405 [Caldilineaceae bacterium]